MLLEPVSTLEAQWFREYIEQYIVLEDALYFQQRITFYDELDFHSFYA